MQIRKRGKRAQRSRMSARNLPPLWTNSPTGPLAVGVFSFWGTSSGVIVAARVSLLEATIALGTGCGQDIAYAGRYGCRTGITTNYACGSVQYQSRSYTIDPGSPYSVQQVDNEFNVPTACSNPGDSGGQRRCYIFGSVGSDDPAPYVMTRLVYVIAAALATVAFAAVASAHGRPHAAGAPVGQELIPAFNGIERAARAEFRGRYGCVLDGPRRIGFLITSRSQRDAARAIVRQNRAAAFTRIAVIDPRYGEPKMLAVTRAVLRDLGNDDPNYIVRSSPPQTPAASR